MYLLTTQLLAIGGKIEDGGEGAQAMAVQRRAKQKEEKRWEQHNVQGETKRKVGVKGGK